MRSLLVLLGLFFSSSASADFARYYRDSNASISSLGHSGQVLIDSSHRLYNVEADASTVMTQIDIQKLKQGSLAFNEWAQMRMPGVQEMYIVQWVGPTELLVWMNQTAPGGTTRQYMQVKIAQTLPGGAFGNTFEVVHPSPLYRLPNGRILPDSSAFSRFRGSWYAEPTGTPNQVYVRYYVDATVASLLPAWVVGSVAESSLVDGIRQMMAILAQYARL